MSDSSRTANVSLVPWLLIFIILKVYGVAAAWSWWWIFLPAAPVVVIVLQALGIIK